MLDEQDGARPSPTTTPKVGKVLFLLFDSCRRPPAGVGPKLATDCRISDHKANGIGDFLGTDKAFQLGLRQHFGADVFLTERPHHGSIGESRVDHAATDAVIHRLGHERRCGSFQARLRGGIGNLADIAARCDGANQFGQYYCSAET